MICQNCSSPNPEGQAFCGSCGHRLIPETIGSLSERLTKLERQQLDDARNKVNQGTLEIETAQNVAERVKTWTGRMLFFTGLPVGILALALAVIFGKGDFDLHTIAANAKTSVNDLLDRARNEAASAESTARGALETSTQVDANIKATQQVVSNLKAAVDARSADVQQLGAKLASSREQLEALNNKMNAQEMQFAHMTEQVKAVQTSKSVEDIQTIYPIYGKHFARTTTGLINAKAKPPGALYLALNLSLTQTPVVSDAKVADAETMLGDHKYTVTIGPVYTEARTANSTEDVGVGLDSNGCGTWVKPPSRPPCILYFRPALKNSALEVRDLVKVAQEIPLERIFYIDPAKLDAQQKELLDLSAIDFLVVLGQ